MRDLIVVGGGELARVIMETAISQGTWNLVGFSDPEPCSETTRRLGVPRLGNDDILQDYPDAMCVLGVGTINISPIRERIVNRLAITRERWATIVHSSAVVSSTANLSPGVVVLPGVVICTGANIAEHCIINLGAKIDHDVHIGKFVHVAPQAALGGGSRVLDNSYIGMAAVIRDHITVSARTLVGMGAVVSKEFPAGSTLIGIPAKPMAAS